MTRLVLVSLLLAACSHASDPERAAPAPSAADDQKVANDIAQTAKEVYAAPPEPIADRDKQAAVAPTALTKDKLVVSALGPALDYTVDKLTAKDLVVTMMIMPGMGSSTVLERAK